MISSHTESLYRLQKKDVRRAGEVLADAFRDDPVWKKVFIGIRPEQTQSMFEVPIHYCLRYGQVYATSENLEGLITWVPGNLADMTPWQLLRSGAIWAGLSSGVRLALRMQPIFRPTDADRKANMKDSPYLYLPILGVAPAFQGQGLGSRLLSALVAESDRAGVSIYLETETESNVRWYGKYGFEIIKQIILPLIELPVWEMVRRPER
jgi:ribosomal protein S18 acetylase RimI-like enzyme